MRSKNIVFIFLLSTLILLSLTLFAQTEEPAQGFQQLADYYHFVLWDTDDEVGGRFLSKSEFLMGLNYSNLYNHLNTDKNIGISLEAVRAVIADLFAGLDKDHNGMLSEAEFTKYNKTDSGLFKLLNADGQESLKAEEFITGIFHYWNENTDDFLQEQEFAIGIFNLVDLDKNGQIDLFELTYFKKG